jgi:HAD superfamily hydrolase (TIGR01484 family)
MKKYKAIIFDIDGTLVVNDPNARPSKRIIDAIRRAESHIMISVATGRSIREAGYIIDLLKINGLCILNHGAQIYDPGQKKSVWESCLNRVQAIKIAEIFRKNGFPVYLFNTQKDHEYNGEITGDPIYGLWSRGANPEESDRLEKDFRELNFIALNKMPSWDNGGMSIEITKADATKQHAIEKLVKLIHISRDDIIGVGDSYNDFPLLMACGLKIAMGNAVPELKSIADFIAPSVEDDGVATVIEKFILNE